MIRSAYYFVPMAVSTSANATTRTPSRASASDAESLTQVITRLRRALRTSIRTDYPWESLPMAHVELMQALGDQRAGLRVGELAQTLRLAQNTVSGLIQQLFEKGFVDRTPDPADRRAVRITLAAQGRVELDSWIAAHERRIEDALGRLSAEDREALARAVLPLGHLVDELN
jgi:DNA-binding MarR family transcriptional regulator